MTSVVSYPCTLGDLCCISARLRATGDAVGSPLSAADQLVSISYGLRQKEATVQRGTAARMPLHCVCGLWWVIGPAPHRARQLDNQLDCVGVVY